jgi:hypothetical protein
MRLMRSRLAPLGIALVLALVACAPQAAVPPAAPKPAAAKPEPAPAPAEPEDPTAGAAAIPEAPAHCAVLVDTLDRAHQCPSPETHRAALLSAVSAEPADARPGLIAALESCPAYEPGLLRVLRAELAPVECRDRVVAAVATSPVLADGATAPGPRPAVSKEVRDALEGHAIAAQLSRLVQNPPRITPPFDKPSFNRFFEAELAPWVLAQAKAIDRLSRRGAALSGYGKGVVAIEAGLADMRFVEVARNVPLPEELANDPELRDAYYGSLDLALEPRKVRGRDAALAGLKRFSEEGVLADSRLERARRLLSELYGGSHVDALDALLLPELPQNEPASLEAKLVSRLPTFVARRLLPKLQAEDASVLRASYESGLPAELAGQLSKPPATPESAYLAARLFFKSGQLYFRGEDFRRAEALASQVTTGSLIADARLLAATARALSQGPESAAFLMQSGIPPRAFDVKALEGFAPARGPLAGYARYNAAVLLELMPPSGDPRAHFTDLAQRYRRAAGDLARAEKARALERADAAAATAKSVH